MDLRAREYVARSMAVDAKVESRESIEAAIDRYRAQHITYVPLPASEEFYHVDDDWIGDLRSEQLVRPDLHLLDVLERLTTSPFLLVTRWEGASPYGFINRADVNKRVTREMIYPLIAELERMLGSRIESAFDSRELFGRLSDRTVGSWVKDAQEGVELHIAETMDLGDMSEVLRQSEPSLARSCGFESKDDLDDLGGIRALRNKVMHANRSFARGPEDIRWVLERIERTQALIRRANSGAAFE